MKLRSNKDNSLSVSRVKTNTGQRAFHSCAPSLWNNLPLSVRSAISVATFKKHLKTRLFDFDFPPKTPACLMACWSYGIHCFFTEFHCFYRFCCWTPIRLARHWAWLRRRYWRYRNLTDWLIDWLIAYEETYSSRGPHIPQLDQHFRVFRRHNAPWPVIRFCRENFDKPTGPVTSFLGFPIRVHVCMPHGLPHAVIHFFVRMSSAAENWKKKNRYKESRPHHYDMIYFR